MQASVLTNLSTALTNFQTDLLKRVRFTIVKYTGPLAAGATKTFSLGPIVGAGNMSKYDWETLRHLVLASADNNVFVNSEYSLTVSYDKAAGILSVTNDTASSLYIDVLVDLERV